MDRRDFLKVGAGIAAAAWAGASDTATGEDAPVDAVKGIADELVREGVEEAIAKTLRPAARQKLYPGHFMVTFDGRHHGTETTWPGLDGWEIAGAYLVLGETRIALDYFDFVQASQRKDGHIPMAIFPGESPHPAMNATLRGLHYPEDVYTYQPVQREGQPPDADMSPRKWIGLFDHWQRVANPLGVLAPISYVLMASEIAAHVPGEWLAGKFDSVEAAGRYVLSRKSENGLLAGAGFYMELPPRHQWDGVTQCYAVHAFRLLSEMGGRLGREESAQLWRREADVLTESFRTTFWRGDHFAEYVHPEHGVVDSHGLSDVNWAAVAWDVATAEQARTLWPLMLAEKRLWHGGMPTQTVARPYSYQDWELCEPLPWEMPVGDYYDSAAMGRVWFLEAQACLKMGEKDRLKESVRKVCEMGKRHDWYWYERYHMLQVREVYAAGPQGYCEYPAVLVRIVLGNMGIFG